MPRFTLSTLVAVAAISSKVYAQDPSGTTSSVIPLASKHFDYNNLVRFTATLILSSAIPNPIHPNSHTKLTLTMVFVAHSPVTTGATRQPRTKSPSARPPLLTRLMVIFCSPGALLPLIAHINQLIFRFLSLGSPHRSHHHR